MTTGRTLVLMRHAKASASAPTDHDRPLTDQGREAARAAGEWLGSQGLAADAALVSDAVRTRETWELVAEGARWDVAPQLSAPLYAADPQSALDLVTGTEADVRCLVVVGHNPTVAFLAQQLDDGAGDSEAVDAMITAGYPPGTVTVFEVSGEWADLTQARLLAHHVPGR